MGARGGAGGERLLLAGCRGGEGRTAAEIQGVGRGGDEEDNEEEGW